MDAVPLGSHGGVFLRYFHIHGGTLVCMDATGRVEQGDLLVLDDRILAIGSDVAPILERLGPDAELRRFDARGALVLPGFVHGHMHLCQTLFRGAAEQSDLLLWLRERIWPLEMQHTPASMAASVRLGLCELIAGGVTTINDMGTVHHTDVVAETLIDMGIRAVFGPALMDAGEGVPNGMLRPARAQLDDTLAIAKRYDRAGDGRLHVSLAPRFILSCSEGLWHDVAALSRERGMLIHTHIAEAPTEGAAVKGAVGCHATPYFEKHGVLSERFVGAHGVWLDEEEMGIMARANAALVHCPGSNMKLASGWADVAAWKRHGIRCGLGSDGAACNNRLDTFTEMGLAAGINRIKHRDDPMSARDIVALATCDGARALGLFREIGSLECGKQADIAVVDVSTPRCAPFGLDDPYTALVHGANSSDVTLTMCAGKVLYDWGDWKTMDPLAVVAESRREGLALLDRARAAGTLR